MGTRTNTEHPTLHLEISPQCTAAAVKYLFIKLLLCRPQGLEGEVCMCLCVWETVVEEHALIKERERGKGSLKQLQANHRKADL